ncbi:MAG TPA: CBASS oligonucleotide cyclase [Acidimicrobiales bacterium]|nr:CBASS oligonucleotide cyclase [Acidimicrobiales bacterium]
MGVIGHPQVNSFCMSRVNLPKDIADKHRAQVKRLRERLEKKIDDDPSFDLVKMLHAGSVAKGTALRTVNDLDVAVYVKAGSAPKDDSDLQPWLADRLREANPNMGNDQFIPQEHCVKVSFRGSGLDVDMVPVLYEGDAADCGYLVRKNSGERVMTSIPRHLEFIRARKTKYGDDFKQLVRLVKWWRNVEAKADADFRFKSFMIELLWARLADNGVILCDYPSALEAFFTYLVKSELRERIFFTDYYRSSQLPGPTGNPIEVFDPVNPENNVAINYTTKGRSQIVSAAGRALDALGEARYAVTKGDEIDCWQDVLGPSFQGGL